MGVESHFFSYIGTVIKISDKFLLVYIGFNINNIDLIKEFKIEFLKREGNIGKYFQNLIKPTYACGPFYDYETVGSSTLSLVEERDGIYWYKLDQPIFIDKDVDVMQIYYKPNNKGGELSIEITDLILMDKDKNFYRGNLKKNNLLVESYAEWESSECNPDFKYYAYLADEEIGNIDFEKNLNNNSFDIYFENIGRDKIIIDNHTLKKIEEFFGSWKIKDIIIEDSNKNTIAKIPFDQIKNILLGKNIEPGKKINIPLILLEKLNKNSSYSVAFNLVRVEGDRIDNQNIKKFIIWFINKDPYYYYSTREVDLEGKIRVKNFNVDDRGNIKF